MPLTAEVGSAAIATQATASPSILFTLDNVAAFVYTFEAQFAQLLFGIALDCSPAHTLNPLYILQAGS